MTMFGQVFTHFKQFDVAAEVGCVSQVFDFNPEVERKKSNVSDSYLHIHYSLESLHEFQLIFLIRWFVANQSSVVIGGPFHIANKFVYVPQLMSKIT